MTIPRRRRISATLLATTGLVLSAALAGCAGADDSSGDDGGAIQIATQGPLTGPNAQLGVEVVQGIELALDEINEAGGVDGRKIELTKYDDVCEASQSTAVASRVTGHSKFVAVIGNVCSGATLAALPTYQRAGLPVLAATTSLPSLSDEGFENFARVVPSDEFQAAQVAKLAVDGLGAKKVALLYSNDDLGQSIAEVTQAALEDSGAELVASESYITGKQQDFSSLLSNIAEARPDALILGGYYAEMAAAVRQSARAFGSDLPLLVGGGQLQSPDFIELAGPAVEGAYISTLYDEANPAESNQKFVKNFEAAYDLTPGAQAALGYATAYVFRDALDEANGDFDNLMELIKAVEYEGPVGQVRFDDKGDNVAGSTVVVRVEDGKFTVDEELTSKLG